MAGRHYIIIHSPFGLGLRQTCSPQAHDGRIALATAELEVCGAATFERAMLAPAEPRALRHDDARVADLGVRAVHVRAVRIEIGRGDHALGWAR
jgi:hypothetical protein